MLDWYMKNAMVIINGKCRESNNAGRDRMLEHS